MARRLILLLGVSLWGCADDRTPAATEEDPPPPTSEDAPVDLGELAELGYVEYSTDITGGEDGVQLYDPGRSCPGYTLYVAIPDCKAVLIDARGQEQHAWHDPDGVRWKRVRLQ